MPPVNSDKFYSLVAWQVSGKLGNPIMILLIWPVGQDVIAAPGSSDPAVQYKYAMSQLQDQVRNPSADLS